MTDTQVTSPFRLAYVPGVTPTKWVNVWKERMPQVPLSLVQVPAAEGTPALRQGDADAGLVRLPVDRTVLSAIPLYLETTVVVVPREHPLAEAAEVTAGELAECLVLHPLDEVLEWETRPGQPAKERPATTADAIQLVAAGIGVLVVPQSLARLHHRKDLTYCPVTDAPQSQVALAWPEAATTDLVEEFIGIVRGRTVNSTRGRAETPPQPKQQKQRDRAGSDGGGGKAGDRRRQKGGAAGRAAGGGGRPRTGSGSGKPKPGKRGKPGRRS
ncbi:LysR family substrate-binding domain-containing protein [Streptacidiphilus carbonis]|uniref:LysR family substrate-binding domain-containing protein n=1 Tax=Streptacidiphilus carbonis TaxID=105422 RepID=UPI0005A73A90|nr:LysR family substrate-binding domain-containing protein [Streptacidiphilus carbonis]